MTNHFQFKNPKDFLCSLVYQHIQKQKWKLSCEQFHSWAAASVTILIPREEILGNNLQKAGLS